MARVLGLAELLFPGRDVSPSDVVRSLSEPETGPPAENLVSNEDSYANGASDAARLAPERGVFLGVGPDQNFSFVASARPLLAIVADYRRRNSLLHLLHKALMGLSGDRIAYLANLTARNPPPFVKGEPSGKVLAETFARLPMDRERLDGVAREVRRYLRPFGLVGDDEWPALATIQAKLAGPGMASRFLGLPGYPTLGRMIAATDRRGVASHFLASEGRYRVVRDLQLGDRILPVVADFAAAVAMPRIAAWLGRHRLALSVVYVSDVEFFLLRAGRFDAYVANLAAMPRLDGAVIARTSTRPIDHPERVPGDKATTIVRDLGAFLVAAKAGKFRSPEDLFAG